jgi:hypothetical protein
MFAVNDMSAARRPSHVLAHGRHLGRRHTLKVIFSATILMLSRYVPSPGAQIGIGTSLELSGALRKRVATEGSAALSRLS